MPIGFLGVMFVLFFSPIQHCNPAEARSQKHTHRNTRSGNCVDHTVETEFNDLVSPKLGFIMFLQFFNSTLQFRRPDFVKTHTHTHTHTIK